MTPISRTRVAMNAIQWFSVKADPTDPESEDLWRLSDPAFRADYPRVLAEIRASGFGAVMLEVLDTQTLQDYARLIDAAGLALAPAYASIGLPEDHGLRLKSGSAERVRWFDGVRRKAEESAYFGLDTVFLAAEVGWSDAFPRTRDAVATGRDFDDARLWRQIEVLTEAAEVLRSEGVRAGLHNHVGTWIETEHEIDAVLTAVPRDLLGASFDIGHLAWAGIDAVDMITRYADRLIDVHVKDLDLEVARRSREVPTPYNSAVNQGLFLEPGLGDLDLDAILAALPADFGGWIIVEVDRASMDPDDSARVSGQWVDRTFAP